MAQLTNLFENTQLAQVLNRHPITCIDVGSRDGFDRDLLPIAFGVDGIGFEPDPTAFEALQCQPVEPWRSMRYLPVPLASSAGERELNIPVHPGSASLFEHDVSVGERFNKMQFFEPKYKIKVSTQTLDEVLLNAPISPAYMKLDVEGLELEVLQGSPRLLGHMVALKLEVSYLPFRRRQPLAADVDLYLRQRGFEVADILNPVHWRIFDPESQAQHGVSIPYSRGQLAHGDYLFFRTAETLDSDTKMFEAAVLAMTYGFFDHAAALMRGPEMTKWLQTKGIASPIEMVGEASAKFTRAVLAQNSDGSRTLLQQLRGEGIRRRLRRAFGARQTS
jgi:FkbM family methyltransferase